VASRTSATYYSEIARTPIIDDPDQEKQLLRRWQEKRDLKARDAIVQTHLRFVVKQAHKRTKDPEAVKDFIAAGNLGLLKAADKFDWKRKPYIRFLTYAGWWIYEEMSNQDYTSSTLVHVPAHRQKAQRRQAREYRAAIQENGPEFVCDMDPGLPEGVVTTLDAARNAADSELEPTSAYGAERLRALVREGISRLPTREQTVLNLYYGVKDEPRNLVQIADLMGMCPERVRQIKINGMTLLHDVLKTRVKLSLDDAYL
jgi:RNA polymerase sigma factor (sigma-70 family)